MTEGHRGTAECLTMTVEAAAEVLGISRGTANTLAKQGRLPVIRISDRRWIVPKRALEALLASVQETQQSS